jgi:DNA repair exonuclease SbcCD ATPase subunit
VGILVKDDRQVEKKQEEKAKDEKQLHDMEERKTKDEAKLSATMEEQDRLEILVETRKALEARIHDLREQCLEEEGTSSLRRLQSKLRDNRRMTASLKNCCHDIAKANKMFREALQIHAQAACSNAIAAGANIGQAIGGGGSRGIGESPGERLMQIRRNQATKKSILIAKEACDILNTAQE